MRWKFVLAAVTLISAVAPSLACSSGYEGTPPNSTPSPPSQSTPAAGSAAKELCESAQPSQAGIVANPELIEISGLAHSRRPDVLWAHNDSGDTARVFALGPGGEALATYQVIGAEATDWEDMASGPGPEDGVQYLYMGDIGDNASLRSNITVYRMHEPALAKSDPSPGAEAIVLQYPDGAHDAETLLADPENGDLYIITKNIAGGPSGVYRAGAPHDTTAPIMLENVGSIDFAALIPRKVIPPGSGALPLGLPRVPTGGEISPDGRMVAVRTYGTIWLWDRAEGQSVADALAGEPCEAPSEIEPQGEAIAFTSDGRGYVTASEGMSVPVHEFSVR